MKINNQSSSTLMLGSIIALSSIFSSVSITESQAYPFLNSSQATPMLTLSDQDREEVTEIINEAIQEERESFRDRIQNEVNRNFGLIMALLTALIAIVAIFPALAGLLGFFIRKSAVYQIACEGTEILENRSKNLEEHLKDTLEKFKLELQNEMAINLEAEYKKSNLIQELSKAMPPSLQDPITQETKQELKSLALRIDLLKSLIPKLGFTADEYVIQGNALFFEGEYDQALEKYDLALELEPDNHEIWYRKGGVLASKWKYADAVKAYEKALELKPEKNEVWRSWGEAVDQLGKKEEVLNQQLKIVEKNPNSVEDWYNLGNMFAGFGEYEKAVENYTKALEIDPNNVGILHSRGNMLADLERFKEAIHDYNKALNIDPQFTWVLNSRGYALANLGDYDKALEDYQKALKIDQNDSWVLERRGYVFIYFNRDEEALDDFDRAIELGRDVPSVYIHRGHALSKLNRLEEANKSYAKAIERCDTILKEQPDSYHGFYDKSVCYALQGNADLAIPCLKRAIELCPLCKLKARTRKDFDLIRQDERFQELLHLPIN